MQRRNATRRCWLTWIPSHWVTWVITSSNILPLRLSPLASRLSPLVSRLFFHVLILTAIASPGKILLLRARMHLKRGHRYGLVGENGAGKTTLMRKLAVSVSSLFKISSIVFTLLASFPFCSVSSVPLLAEHHYFLLPATGMRAAGFP